MSKDDVEIPDQVPHKRRQLKTALDKWLAVWANDPGQPPSARKRAQAERIRRRNLVPDVRVGVIVGQEGMTPAQRERVTELVLARRPTELHVLYPRHARKLIEGLDQPEKKIDWQGYLDAKELVRKSTTVVAAPKETEKPDLVQGVWEAVRYARHRGLPVTIVMPDGEER